jgi:hypothetical protein
MRMSKAEAIVVSLSAGLVAFGTAAAAVPEFVPAEVKVPIAVAAWLAGIIGFSAKKALSQQYSKRATKAKKRVESEEELGGES